MPGLSAPLYVLFGFYAPAADANGSNTMLWTILVPIAVLWYFMFIRLPQQERKKVQQRLDALKKNDRVLTTAGIYGTVVSVDPKEDKVVLRVDDSAKMTFTRSSVVKVFEPSSEKASQSA